ncbi:MAG: hypothetical protein RRB13_00155 [bacterium]|nr:hypothetical protein [bacterium]
MSDCAWHVESCGTGRQYMLGSEAAEIRFSDEEAVIDQIEANIRPFLFAEPAIRLVLDTPLANPERVVLSIPCLSDENKIIRNFAKSIYTSIMGYYYSADPKSSHFGIANTILSGQGNSLLMREMERHFAQGQTRPDMAARVLDGVVLSTENQVPTPGRNYLDETLAKGLNIYVGYRIHAQGETINHAQMFLPLDSGQEIIDLVYYNLEQILNQNFLAYDESGSQYLEINESLVFKELGSILERSRLKENTRKKILNNIQFNTVFTKDPRKAIGEQVGDSLYDALNKVQDERLKAATEVSSSLYAAVMVKSTEMTHMNNPDLGEFKGSINFNKSESKPKAAPKAAKEAVEEEPTLVPEPKTRVPSKEEAESKKAPKKKAEVKEEELEEIKASKKK